MGRVPLGVIMPPVPAVAVMVRAELTVTKLAVIVWLALTLLKV